MNLTHHTNLCRIGGRGFRHRAANVDGRLVPACRPTSIVKWHILPGNVLITCPRCIEIIRRNT